MTFACLEANLKPICVTANRARTIMTVKNVNRQYMDRYWEKVNRSSLKKFDATTSCTHGGLRCMA